MMQPVTIALAKGRPAKQSIDLLEAAGIHFEGFHEKTRKLVFFNKDKTLRLIFLKGMDVPIYVEKGAADIGIVGRDNIIETEADVYEILDLGIGKCKFSVAGKKGVSLPENQSLTIGTKYPNIAKNFFDKRNQTIETVHLNGSVELAPLIGLADYIVDIVETGNTLHENGLEILADIETISTKFIVNKASFVTRSKEIQDVLKKLEQVVSEKNANSPL
ncbi:ATP phosphoribosyltransferase [Oceanobacillus sp. FSL W7-1293]|uniref:ATP phosphoribosyltransferase n=1 Tax=Oceanobacillus TaxID=182709 RepID=UPI0030D1EA00